VNPALPGRAPRLLWLVELLRLHSAVAASVRTNASRMCWRGPQEMEVAHTVMAQAVSRTGPISCSRVQQGAKR